MDRYVIKIVVEPDGDSFYAYCPGLPEVHTCGATQEEAAKNAQEAASAVIRAKERFGDPIQLGLDLRRLHAPTPEEAQSYLRREEQVLL